MKVTKTRIHGCYQLNEPKVLMSAGTQLHKVCRRSQIKASNSVTADSACQETRILSKSLRDLIWINIWAVFLRAEDRNLSFVWTKTLLSFIFNRIKWKQKKNEGFTEEEILFFNINSWLNSIWVLRTTCPHLKTKALHSKTKRRCFQCPIVILQLNRHEAFREHRQPSCSLDSPTDHFAFVLSQTWQ